MKYARDTSVITLDLTYPAMRTRALEARHRRMLRWKKWRTGAILLLVLLGMLTLRRLG